MPVPSNNPAELEARLLKTIAALRRINGAIDSLIDAQAPAIAIANVAALCSLHAGQTADEATR
jgi:hypothetical protein